MLWAFKEDIIQLSPGSTNPLRKHYLLSKVQSINVILISKLSVRIEFARLLIFPFSWLHHNPPMVPGLEHCISGMSDEVIKGFRFTVSLFCQVFISHTHNPRLVAL